MSAVFEGYERQYCDLSSILSNTTISDGERKKQKSEEIKAALDEADDLLRKMDLEARSVQPSLKATFLVKVREYKKDLNNLKSQVKRVTTPENLSARDLLLETGEADTLTASNDQRGRLLMATDRINQSSDRIKASRRTVLETEELGVSILQDLHQQRQSLLHASNTLHGADEIISKSKKVLAAMTKRMSRNKWIMAFIVVVLVVAILVFVFFKIFHH